MVRHSNTWVFNIAPENWNDCVSGPSDASVHGEENVGNPWQGLRGDPQGGPDIEPGDVVIARVTSADGTNDDWGVKGIWEFAQAARVVNQTDVPWDDAEYEWMLYCRPLHREFGQVLKEDFGTAPSFTSNTLQGAIKSLEPDDKAEYLRTILEESQVGLSSDAQSRLQSELSNTDIQDTFESFRSEDPDIWIEKTYREGRDYKQSGELKLGNAIYSPSQDKGGGDRYKTMREAEVGDVVLHLLHDNNSIVGVSRIQSELNDDFDGLEEFGWTEEQQAAGGYLRWLQDYTELETPVDVYAAVFNRAEYADRLHELRESHTYLPYDKNLQLTEGAYLSRCPPALAGMFAAANEELQAYLNEAGVDLPEPPTGESTGDDDDPPTSEFSGITEATSAVIDRLAARDRPNPLAARTTTTQVRTWSAALSGFQPAGYIDPEELAQLEDLLALLEDMRADCRRLAEELSIGSLDSAAPAEVVFLALLRDLQAQDDDIDQVNANHAKLNALQRDAYLTFDNPDHPLVTHLRSTDADVWALTAPAGYWLTALRYRAYGLEDDYQSTWEDITPGDLLIFHVAGSSEHPALAPDPGFVFGAAVVGGKTIKEEAWWYDERTGDEEFHNLLAFDRVFVTDGASRLGDPPAVEDDTDTAELRTAAQRLSEQAVPISEINDLCTALVDTEFPARSGVDKLEDDTPYGRAAGILDRLADETTEISPVAIHRDFTGRIPPAVLDDLHFPADAGIATAEELAGQITAALRAGDHIIFTGPPGTGKTEVAEAVATHLAEAYPYLYSGSQLTTATADWSTFDTVGGYMPDPEVAGDALSFHPGVLLNRFKNPNSGAQRNEPTIIDEINRANIDKAFGQLFTTLSGQAVTVPFRLDGADDAEIEVVPAGQTDGGPVARHQFVMPDTWRVLGTMNTFDKTSLYEISYAFMRRFTFIRIGVPDIPEEGSDQEEFLEAYADTWGLDPAPQTLRQVAAVWRATNTAIPERSIGPAIVRDILAYMTAHEDPSGAQLTDAVISYVFPQLEGVPDRDEIVDSIASVGTIDTDKLGRAAADMLGIQAQDWDTPS